RLRYNLLTAQYPLPHLITFAETTDHLHRNPQARAPLAVSSSTFWHPAWAKAAATRRGGFTRFRPVSQYLAGQMLGGGRTQPRHRVRDYNEQHPTAH
ncbi:hypothetical protein, partial [Ralstonia pseudosolanacearum]